MYPTPGAMIKTVEEVTKRMVVEAVRKQFEAESEALTQALVKKELGKALRDLAAIVGGA